MNDYCLSSENCYMKYINVFIYDFQTFFKQM